MYHSEEELLLLETITKGRRSKFSPKLEHHFNQDKYKFYKRSFKGLRDFRTPSTEDMLHTASRKTQAIFKISSFGKGTKRIAAHLNYISRRGKLELEDHIGNKIRTIQDQKEKLDAWAFDFGDGGRTRDTMHVVLSTPPATNPDIALKAAKEFLEKEFKQSGHEYLFVQHRDTSHPHVHAVIKMMSCYGNKINPRKAYLHSVRHHFAAICRSYGIQVEASSRAERGLFGPSKKSQLVHAKRLWKNNQANIDCLKHFTASTYAERIIKRKQIIRKRYMDKSRKLMHATKGISNVTVKGKFYHDAKILCRHAMEITKEFNQERHNRSYLELDF